MENLHSIFQSGMNISQSTDPMSVNHNSPIDINHKMVRKKVKQRTYANPFNKKPFVISTSTRTCEQLEWFNQAGLQLQSNN